MVGGVAGELLRSHRVISHSSPFLPRQLTAQSILRPLASRSFHTPSRSLLPRRQVPRPHTRHISISSLWKPPQPTLSPFKIWRIEKLETDADAFPMDPTRQVQLYQGLAEADIKSCYERIIRRWERMCEFSPANPTLANDEAFRLYVLSLVKTGKSESVASATRRRDTILAKQGASATTTDGAIGPETTPATPSTAVPSQSDKIAESVLQDPKAHAKLNPLPDAVATGTSPAASVAAATATGTPLSPISGVQTLLAAGGAGGKDMPIYVTIAQRT